MLVRELDERLGLSQIIADNLADNRRGKNTQLPLPDLLRQSIYSRLAGYENLNDAERLSQDPTFRLIGSEKFRDRGAALPSRLHWFETQVLTQATNLSGLAAMSRELIARAEGQDQSSRAVLDVAALLIRPVGRPGNKPVVCHRGLLYRAASWTTARRVVAKVEHHAGELFTRLGFIVTNTQPANRKVVRF